MQAIDTNVLIRILVDDSKQSEQVHAARQFAKKTGHLYVPQIVQVELVWVLESAYRIKKNEIIEILHHLQINEAYILQNEENYASALQLFQRYSADFSDCLIWAECETANAKLTTFDKKLAALPLVHRL